MEFFENTFSDLLTGCGVPAVYSLASAGNDAVWVGLGGGLAGGLALTAVRKYRPQSSFTLQLARHLLCVSLSAKQLFYVFDARNGDIGAGLAAVPLFFAVCMQPAGFLTDYARDARLVCSCLTLACTLASAVHYTLQGDANKAGEPVESQYDPALLWFLRVVGVAFASSSEEGELVVSLCRGGLLAALGWLVPSALKGLLSGPHPLVVVAAYGAALAWSAHHSACRARLAASAGWSPRDPQRALMLMVAPALAVGFVERRGDPGHALFAVLVTVLAGVLQALLPCKWGARSE